MSVTNERPDGVPGKGRTDVDQALLGGTTYRSLGQQRLSPAEERFERGRRTTGFWLAPLVLVVFLLLPLDMPNDQQTLAAVLLGVIVLWITEPVPIPIGGLIGVPGWVRSLSPFHHLALVPIAPVDGAATVTMLALAAAAAMAALHLFRLRDLT